MVVIALLLAGILVALAWQVVLLRQQRDLLDGLGDMIGEALDVWYDEVKQK